MRGSQRITTATGYATSLAYRSIHLLPGQCLVILIPFRDSVHDAIHQHVHTLVKCSLLVHKNDSSFCGWCILTLKRGKSNYKMGRNDRINKTRDTEIWFIRLSGELLFTVKVLSLYGTARCFRAFLHENPETAMRQNELPLLILCALTKLPDSYIWWCGWLHGSLVSKSENDNLWHPVRTSKNMLRHWGHGRK